MDFRISQLHGFLTLADHLHYGSASRALAVSQPTLAFRINSLEDNLQVKLFVRTRKGLALTEAGHGFRNYARSILDTTERAHSNMEAFRTPGPRALPPVQDIALATAKTRVQ
jgi:DNA-binding transcriptional LysR family regulator